MCKLFGIFFFIVLELLNNLSMYSYLLITILYVQVTCMFYRNLIFSENCNIIFKKITLLMIIFTEGRMLTNNDIPILESGLVADVDKIGYT